MVNGLLLTWLNSNRVFTFGVSITEEQAKWGKITNNIVLDVPINGALVVLIAFNPSIAQIKYVYVRSDGALYNTSDPLTKGNWYISGAYKITK